VTPRPVRRQPTLTSFAPRIVALVAAGVLATSCAETVVQVESDSGEVNVGGSFETVPTTTLPITGTTAQLLVEMANEMGKLSSEISAPGDEKATLLRIETIWDTIRTDVESTNPELLGGIDTTVDMSRTAVERVRPADGDKALQILTGLIGRYTGDG
jgi:hypothetical protein